ncbi:MAG: conjugal transfer protein TraF [Rickettsiales bacterium]|nr:conjugal transfer protein TraF [Rickettsiales bacterium]
MQVRLTKYFVVLLCIPFVMGSKITPDICRKYNLGRNWYCQEKRKQDDLPSAYEVMNAPISDIEKGRLIKKLEELQRLKAVVGRKRKDQLKWLETQHLIADSGIGFANDIQKIAETNPRFQANDSYYKSVTNRLIADAEKENILRKAKDKYGIVFVYSTSCNFCHRQLPILLELKKKWQFKVLGITLTGQFYSGLDEQIIDQNIFQDTDVFPDRRKSIPRVLLLDLKRGKKIFISKGLSTLDQLEHLISNRIKEVESEKRN